MAIVPISKIRIYAHSEKRGKLLKFVQRLGVLEIKKPEEREDASFSDRFGQISFFDRSIQSAKTAIEALSKYSQEKKPLLSAKRIIPEEEYDSVSGSGDKLLSKINKINSVINEISNLKNEEARLAASKESYVLWKDLDIPLNFKGTKNTAAIIGTIPLQTQMEAALDALAQVSENVYFEEVYAAGEQRGIFVLCEEKEREEVMKALIYIGFARPSFATVSVTAAEQIKNIENEIEALRKKRDSSEKSLEEYAKDIKTFEVYFDYLNARRERYVVREKVLNTKKTFMLEGYVPERDAVRVKESVEAEFECFAEVLPLEEDEQPPVIFENNAFVAPVEPVVEMYSMPSKTDVDPNPVMSVFYYFFFGLMLSDAGYGLVLLIAGIILQKKYKPEGTMGKMIKMFTICGAFTMFWGALFGSWFGDLIPKAAQTFFGKNIGSLGIYDPVADPIPLLILSFVLGFVHLFTGMGINFYNLTRQGKLKDAIFDIGFWYLLLIGLIMIIPMGPLGKGVIGAVGKWLAIGGAVGLILTQGRSKPNLFGRIFGGVGSLYDVTSYLSDILSYSRLLALGLATGVISQVINTMAALGGRSIIGVIMFIAVVLVGHTMNVLINLLGAFVHTNRLQYVEFFKKFYEGGGRKFEPFAMNTKYTKFKEE